MKIKLRYVFIISIFLTAFTSCQAQTTEATDSNQPLTEEQQQELARSIQVENVRQNHPLSIDRLRSETYPGSIPVIETTLNDGSNYSRYIASYLSEGLKQRGLLTIPKGTAPENGWPIIIFNHGFIPPTVYRTTERYVAYQDAFASAGFITYKPDYRGHDQSEGIARGAYGDPGFTVDILNAAASIKQLSQADPERIGLWGHSMGGFVSLESLVIRPDWFKASVIWGGVVASPIDRQRLWWDQRNRTYDEGIPQEYHRRSQVSWNSLGSMTENNDLWDLISANSYIEDIQAPIQLHHSDTDETVPVELSQVFYEELVQAEKPAEIYIYAGDNHNISNNLTTALTRSVEFFKENL